jgi:hypothetical protein
LGIGRFSSAKRVVDIVERVYAVYAVRMKTILGIMSTVFNSRLDGRRHCGRGGDILGFLVVSDPCDVDGKRTMDV